MAAADLAAWRKQNSDPMTVDMVMTDSSTMRAIVMIPKGKTLKDVFNVDDTFLEVECLERGQIVFQREALRSVRACALPAADQMDKRIKAAEKLGAHTVLQVPKSATADMIAAACDRLRDKYDPARAATAGMPPEVIEFMAAMCRRFEAARSELEGLLPATAQQPAA